MQVSLSALRTKNAVQRKHVRATDRMPGLQSFNHDSGRTGRGAVASAASGPNLGYVSAATRAQAEGRQRRSRHNGLIAVQLLSELDSPGAVVFLRSFVAESLRAELVIERRRLKRNQQDERLP